MCSKVGNENSPSTDADPRSSVFSVGNVFSFRVIGISIFGHSPIASGWCVAARSVNSRGAY
jgi:hypothetical protein